MTLEANFYESPTVVKVLESLGVPLLLKSRTDEVPLLITEVDGRTIKYLSPKWASTCGYDSTEDLIGQEVKEVMRQGLPKDFPHLVNMDADESKFSEYFDYYNPETESGRAHLANPTKMFSIMVYNTLGPKKEFKPIRLEMQLFAFLHEGEPLRGLIVKIGGVLSWDELRQETEYQGQLPSQVNQP